MGNKTETFQEAGKKVALNGKMKKFDVAGGLFKRNVDVLSSVEAQGNKRAA